MLSREGKQTDRGAVGAEFIGYNRRRREALLLQEFPHQPNCRPSVPAGLNQEIQDFALTVHGTPEIELPPSNYDDHLVQVPAFGRSWPPTLNPPRIGPTEFQDPSSNCLIRDVETTLGKQVLNVPIAQRETAIEPDSMLDDDRWKAVTTVGYLAHPETLKHRPCRSHAVNVTMPFKRKLGVRAVFDMSATPFFLSGSGWAEGTLFPWTVSDFSLIDAIECGIVKLPRVPVADNIPGADVPIFRNLWDHIGKGMPKKGKQVGDPLEIPDILKTALHALYKHYEETYEQWERAGIETPPVFIVVCNNTSTSKLVHEWISGWQRPNKDGDEIFEHHGHLKLFQNFDEHGNPFPRPNTLLIDSQQIESGELDKNFRAMAAAEIEQFKREMKQRSGAGDVGELSDAELLRAVMNTVGKKDRLGEQVRCVVSVSMLTEGWDILALSRLFEFDGETMAAAIRATFERRGTVVPATIPDGLDDKFAEDEEKQRQWRAFTGREPLLVAAPDLPTVIREIGVFIMPAVHGAIDDHRVPGCWSPDKGWSPTV